MSWQPLNETYFVIPDEIKVSSLIPDHLKEKFIELRTGIVIKVGTGTLLESGIRMPLQAHEGDQVLFGAKAGAEVEVDGTKYLLLAEPNILAVNKTHTNILKSTCTLKED